MTATDTRTARVLATVVPEMREKVTALLARMKTLGYPMVATDGNRTTAEQQALYAQGRTKPGRIVTKADGVKRLSNHQGGRAVDCTFLNDKGRAYYPPVEEDPTTKKVVGIWALYGREARALGLKWGGDFNSITDCPHVELPK